MSGEPRLDVQAIDPRAYKAVLAMEGYVRSGTLDPGLLNLIKIRASQLNGCAFCLDMHNREAVEKGESPRRLYILAGWREAPDLFTAAERAALSFTEAVTLISKDAVGDDVWHEAAMSFSEEELVQLLMAISTINVWNRLAVATHQQLPELP